jgi:hypothetical protein
MGRRVNTLVMDKGNGMPSMDQFLPYVLRRCRRSTDSGAWATSRIILLDRLVALVASRSLTLSFSCCYASTFSCAVVRLRCMTYCWRISFSFEGEERNHVLLKHRSGAASSIKNIVIQILSVAAFTHISADTAIALYEQILAEQLFEPEPILTPSGPQPALELSTSLLIEALGYLTQLQEFLANLQNQVRQSIHKVEQALNNSNSPHPAIAEKVKDVKETPRRRY